MDIWNRKWIEVDSQTRNTLTPETRVLDVGSYIVDGQEDIQCRNTIEPIVKDYVGLDMRPGSGVDVVASASNIPLDSKTFDTVICLDMLEHCDRPYQAIQEIFRVIKPGGYLYLATVFNFIIHDYPSDYWRFTPNCLRLLLEEAGFDVIETWPGSDNMNPTIVRAIGRRPDG